MDVLTADYPELLGRVFAAIDDEERCDTVPLVCRAWLTIHNEYPPHRKALTFTHPIGKAHLCWFLKVAPQLEELDVTTYVEEPASLLPQLLAIASLVAPRLRRFTLEDMSIAGINTTDLSSMVLVGQLSWLKFGHLDISSECSHVVLRNFSALRSLQVLRISLMTLYAESSKAEHLWRALATLTGLTRLDLNVGIEDAGNTSVASILQSVSLLTRLRSLEVLGPSNEHEDAILPSDLIALTQLSELELWFIPSWSGRRMLSLPNLERVVLSFRFVGWQPPSISWESTRLASLEIEGFGLGGKDEDDEDEEILPMESVLSKTMPASSFRRLKSLSLTYLQLDSFPTWLAESLQQLTHLDLSDNRFRRVPATLAALTALQTLVIGCNRSLSLHPDDVQTFSALPQLQSLSVWQNLQAHLNWSGTDLDVVWALGRCLPHLQCRFSKD